MAWAANNNSLGVCLSRCCHRTDSEVAFAFSGTFRTLNSRISIFTAFPLASIDCLSLQRKLDAIGKASETIK